MRPLTVMQLLPSLESGGVERSTLEIADALVREGHRAMVVSAGGRLLPQLLASGAEHVLLDVGRKSLLTWRHVAPLRELMRREPVDIVHARSRLPAWVAVMALHGLPAAARPRLVTTVHGLNSPSRYSAVMTRGERVICVSDTVRRYVLQHYPRTPPGKLRVVPRGIEVADFPAAPSPDRQARAWAAQQHPALDGDGPLLLLPGRGTRLKGHADAVALLASVRGTGLDARLWLPGSRQSGREAYVAELEQLAGTLGVAGALAFTAPISAIARAYAASDLVLQLSRKPEAFGRTVVEALSVGRGVLGWDHGGVGELLRELQPAGAVQPFDAAELSSTAIAMLARSSSASTPEVPLSIPYTLQAMQRATLSVYAELADESSRA